jgi:hypothetical protein
VHLDLSIGRPLTKEGLCLFPVYSREPMASKYLTFSGEPGGDLDIGEQSGGAVVDELVAKNGGDLPVLIIEGEMVLGDLQNRTLNISVLCAAGTDTVLPVSCVEQGRWQASSGGRRSRHHASPRLRRTKTTSVIKSATARQGWKSDQAAVWQDIAGEANRRHVSSATGAIEDVYTAARKHFPHGLATSQPLDGQVGVVVGLGGRVCAVDLFDRPDTLDHYWQALLAGYALDLQEADAGGPALSADAVLGLLKSVEGAKAEEVPTGGLGRQFCLRSSVLDGLALVWDDAVVHLTAFANVPGQ